MNLFNKKKLRLGAYFIGAVFLSSGLSKLFIINRFINSISIYKLIPEKFNTSFGIGLIVIEIIVGFLFYFPKYLKITSGIACILLVGFLLLSLYAKVKNININCDCFSFIRMKITSFSHFFLNVLLLLISYFTFIYSTKRNENA